MNAQKCAGFALNLMIPLAMSVFLLHLARALVYLRLTSTIMKLSGFIFGRTPAAAGSNSAVGRYVPRCRRDSIRAW